MNCNTHLPLRLFIWHCTWNNRACNVKQSFWYISTVNYLLHATWGQSFAFQTINIGDWFWGDRLESPLIPGIFQELKLSVSLVSLFKLRKHWLLSQTDPWKLNSLLVCVEIIKLVIFESVKTQLTKVVLIAIRVRASVTYYSWVWYLPDLCQNYVCISSKTIVKIPKKFFLDL